MATSNVHTKFQAVSVFTAVTITAQSCAIFEKVPRGSATRLTSPWSLSWDAGLVDMVYSGSEIIKYWEENTKETEQWRNTVSSWSLRSGTGGAQHRQETRRRSRIVTHSCLHRGENKMVFRLPNPGSSLSEKSFQSFSFPGPLNFPLYSRYKPWSGEAAKGKLFQVPLTYSNRRGQRFPPGSWYWLNTPNFIFQ